MSPAAYAKLAAAGYAGIKAGSPQGARRDRRDVLERPQQAKAGASDSVRPGTFAEGVAKANKKLKFDAWAHHPYPVPVNGKPTQKVLWPNVALTSLPRFETSIDTWFGRKNIPVWITEYGNETKPGEPTGVTEAQQASYVTQAIAIAKKDKRVPMFIWFVMKDSTGSLWQSGVYRKTALPSRRGRSSPPRRARWMPVNTKLSVKGGTKNPSVTVYLRSFCVNSPVGAKIGLTSKTTLGGEDRRRTRSRSSARDRLHGGLQGDRPHGRQGQDVHGASRGEHEERRRAEPHDHDRRGLELRPSSGSRARSSRDLAREPFCALRSSVVDERGASSRTVRISPCAAGTNPAAPAALDEREEVVEIAGHVDDPDRLRVKAELGPGDRLHQLVQGPEAAGEHDEAVRELVHQRLALVERLDHVELGQAAVRDLALLEEARDDPDHASPRRQRRVGDDAHQADLAAAGDELDRPCRERASELAAAAVA